MKNLFENHEYIVSSSGTSQAPIVTIMAKKRIDHVHATHKDGMGYNPGAVFLNKEAVNIKNELNACLTPQKKAALCKTFIPKGQ